MGWLPTSYLCKCGPREDNSRAEESVWAQNQTWLKLSHNPGHCLKKCSRSFSLVPQLQSYPLVEWSRTSMDSFYSILFYWSYSQLYLQFHFIHRTLSFSILFYFLPHTGWMDALPQTVSFHSSSVTGSELSFRGEKSTSWGAETGNTQRLWGLAR